VDKLTILPWWIVQLGFVTEEDMKLADKAEVIIKSIVCLDYPLCKSTQLKPVVHKVH
jgi:hypothetical protein